MKKDKRDSIFADVDLEEIKQDLIDGGMDAYADVAEAILTERFEDAEKLMENGVKEGKMDIEEDVYALFNGIISQLLGMQAIKDNDFDKADGHLNDARRFFILAQDRGLDIPIVENAIDDLDAFLGYDDDDDYDESFDVDAVDYLGFKKEFPKGEEFSAVLRMPQESFSIDAVKESYEDNWIDKLKVKKGKKDTWTLYSNGVAIKVEYAKRVESLSPDDLKYFIGDKTDEIVERVLHPSVARVTITALVGDESSYERSVEFTRVVGAILATHEGVSLISGDKIRDPEDTLDVIETYPDDEWLVFVLNVGFIVQGNAAMSNITIVSDGMKEFGFPEIEIKRIGPDDYESASNFMFGLIKYIFQLGLGLPGNGTYRSIDGTGYELKHRKKNGEEKIEIVVKH